MLTYLAGGETALAASPALTLSRVKKEKMRTREIVRRIRKWRDFYGGDIPDVPEVRTKEQAKEILEGHRRLMEETLSDAMSHLDNFERELGLY